MRIPFALIATLALAGFITHTSSARAAGADLSGNMAAFSYLLGGPWNCSTDVPAMGDQAAHTDQGSATFDVVPGNVVHNHVLTATYSGDFYFGYSNRTNFILADQCRQHGRARFSNIERRKNVFGNVVDGSDVDARYRHVRQGDAEQGNRARGTIGRGPSTNFR